MNVDLILMKITEIVFDDLMQVSLHVSHVLLVQRGVSSGFFGFLTKSQDILG